MIGTREAELGRTRSQTQEMMPPQEMNHWKGLS